MCNPEPNNKTNKLCYSKQKVKSSQQVKRTVHVLKWQEKTIKRESSNNRDSDFEKLVQLKKIFNVLFQADEIFYSYLFDISNPWIYIYGKIRERQPINSAIDTY